MIWEEQWLRVNRWFQRFSETASGRPHNRESDFYQDEAYAFFQNIHHLKDWLANDPDTIITKHEVDKLISDSQALRLCGDLCNGSKHLKITNPWVDKGTKIGRRRFNVNFGSAATTQISVAYEVTAGDQKFDAYELAKKSLSEWETFLKGHKLL